MKKDVNNLNQAKLLDNFGFKKNFPDERDPSYSTFVLEIVTNRFLKDLKLTISNSMIDVSCTEGSRGSVPGQNVVISSIKFNAKNLEKLMTFYGKK